MAEFCFECYNKMQGGKCRKENYIISDELDLCEGCGEYKNVVISYKKNWRYHYAQTIMEIIFLPFYLIKILILFIFRLFSKLWNFFKS